MTGDLASPIAGRAPSHFDRFDHAVLFRQAGDRSLRIADHPPAIREAEQIGCQRLRPCIDHRRDPLVGRQRNDRRRYVWRVCLPMAGADSWSGHYRYSAGTVFRRGRDQMRVEEARRSAVADDGAGDALRLDQRERLRKKRLPSVAALPGFDSSGALPNARPACCRDALGKRCCLSGFLHAAASGAGIALDQHHKRLARREIGRKAVDGIGAVRDCHLQARMRLFSAARRLSSLGADDVEGDMMSPKPKLRRRLRPPVTSLGN